MTKKVQIINHITNTTNTSNKQKMATQQVRLTRTSAKLLRHSFGFQTIQFLAFIALGAILLAVVFLLPDTVQPVEAPQLPAQQSAEPAVVATPDSPWSDAQLAKARREAQEILSKILDVQEKLETKKVQRWAQEAFEQAKTTATRGDELYRSREFTQAQLKYTESLSQFNAIHQQVDAVFEQQIRQGQQAILNAQPRQAIKAFELANQLKPVDINAQQGLARAKVQSQVIDLVGKGKHQLKTKQLTQAKATFEQALALDNQSIPAKAQLAKTQTAIIDANFAAAMSKGYNAINANQYQQAISAFITASKIKPQAQDAQQALTQAKNKDLQFKVADHLTQAKTFEAQEQWQQAYDHYSQIQTLDPSVIKGKIGALRTQARATLDQQLEDAINQPQRLADSNGLRQASAIVKDARRVKNQGPRLRNQIEKLNDLIVQVQHPISVQLKSDNQTQVTLYRVGKLGNFSAKQMELKPGKYTLVGTRDGYRDVRREFTLIPGKTAPTIIVQCDEKISNG